jgi:hypothetical protein
MSARRLALPIVALVVALVMITASNARAQQNPQAEQLFRRGQDLVKQGKIAEGCEKFEASQRLESNVNTLLNLASCREKNGQLATAWALFLRAAAEARKNPQDQPLVQVAVGFSAKLEPRLSYLTVSVPDTSRVDGLAIKLDGRSLDPEEFNQGVPVDPGSHEVLGSAPGHEPWTTSISIAEAERKSVEVPRFKEIDKLAPKLDGKQKDIVTQSPMDEPSRGMTTLRKASIGAGAVGVVGLAAMTAFGLQARSKWNDAQATNDDELRKDAESKAGLATIGGVVGIAGVAAGVTLWIVGKPKDGESGAAWMPMVSDREVGLAVGGRF